MAAGVRVGPVHRDLGAKVVLGLGVVQAGQEAAAAPQADAAAAAGRVAEPGHGAGRDGPGLRKRHFIWTHRGVCYDL